MLNPNEVSMIQGLAQAASTLSNVTNSDEQSRHILRSISEIANQPKAGSSEKVESKQSQGEASRVVVFDNKGIRRLEAAGAASWYLDTDGTMHINEVEVVDTVKRPSIAERTRNMGPDEVMELALYMATQSDTTMGEIEQLAKLVGRKAMMMMI
jgi:hypothetical protein